MRNLIVRAATPSDLSELSRLWHEKMILYQQMDRRVRLAANVRTRWEAAARDWLSNETYCVSLVEQSGDVIGFMVAHVGDAPVGFIPETIGIITDLVVDVHRQEGGVGRELLNEVRHWFAARGVSQLMIYALNHHAVEQAFWRAQGATDWVNVLWLK